MCQVYAQPNGLVREASWWNKAAVSAKQMRSENAEDSFAVVYPRKNVEARPAVRLQTSPRLRLFHEPPRILVYDT